MSLLLVQGNALQIPLADKSVQCIVTSPPYWGLRSYAGTATWEGGDLECDHEAARHKNRFDYQLDKGTLSASGGVGDQSSNAGSAFSRYDATCPTCGATRHDAQLGSEPLHDCLGWATGHNCGSCYLCHMRQVARECWRVLRDDGVMFWNIADSYAHSGEYRNTGILKYQAHHSFIESDEGKPQAKKIPPGLKPKDKCGIPERTALAFQADGWWWRSDIVWAKPNPMPESVTDRPTKSHEFVYLFTKAERYFWDAEAVREGNADPDRTNYIPGSRSNGMNFDRHDNDMAARMVGVIFAGRNLRDVWTISTHSYPGQHFATFAPELPRRCIKAGTSERGACPKCGKPWERVVKREDATFQRPRKFSKTGNDDRNDTGTIYTEKEFITLGWRPACTCDAGDPVPCIVLDPFSGAATTGLVARELGRHYIGLELSAEYLKQSRDRLSLTALDEWGNGRKHEADLSDLPMFKV